MTTPHVPLILRRSQLKTILGIAPSTVDRLEAAGKFPKRKRWSTGVVGWEGSEVAAWVSSRVSNVGGGCVNDTLRACNKMAQKVW